MKRHFFDHLVFPNYAKKAQTENSFFRILIYKLIPMHVYRLLRGELRLARIRLSSRAVRKRFRFAKDLLVNLGAGKAGRIGYVNVDVSPASSVNYLYDIRKSLPFPDCSVAGIFCEHFFEHLDYMEEVPAFLSECYRVLRPNGVLRIIVPDAEKYLKAYCENGWNRVNKIRILMTTMWILRGTNI